MNGAKAGTPIVLFNIKKKSGTIFSRKGSEALWRKEESESPDFYINVKE